jgi:hypothetical protein
MLVHARQAQTASGFAPVHDRRAVGTTMIRALFGPSIRWWMHPSGSAVSTGSAVGSITDFSNRGTTISQATASKQPLKSGKEGVPCFAFDGVNDSMATSNVDMSTLQAMTVAIIEYRGNATGCIELELGSDFSNVTTGIGFVANDGSVVNWEAAFRADAGYQIKAVAAAVAPIQRWGAWVAVANKAAPAANELAVYKSGAVVTNFLTNSNTANSTNFFASASWYIGGRSNVSSFFTGMLAQIVVITRALSAVEAAKLSTYAAQAAGIR